MTVLNMTKGRVKDMIKTMVMISTCSLRLKSLIRREIFLASFVDEISEVSFIDGIPESSLPYIDVIPEAEVNSNVNISSDNSTGVRSYNCPYCPYKSLVKTNVKTHVKYRHTGEKPFICPICSRRFAQKQVAERHMKIHGIIINRINSDMYKLKY
ncbi:Zinc finger protein [Armadillidium nasatum]|uniref:Zinc finger protein n=1 Tax=Armadillidium nasatum TaxID=96803 RepID=A0A5N5TNB8_9CRUS|nr:Zinc finger protein [Armadillidium nasatum]